MATGGSANQMGPFNYRPGVTVFGVFFSNTKFVEVFHYSDREESVEAYNST